MVQVNFVLFTCLLILVLIVSVEFVGAGGKGKDHVHLKIHVPHIIKHHHHTKVVLIPKKKPPVIKHKHHHHTKVVVIPKKKLPVAKHKQKYKYQKKNLIENLYGYGPINTGNYQKALKEMKYERLKDAEIANDDVNDTFVTSKFTTGGYRIAEVDNFSSEIVN